MCKTRISDVNVAVFGLINLSIYILQLRAQVPVLKKAVLDEQEKQSNLQVW